MQRTLKYYLKEQQEEEYKTFNFIETNYLPLSETKLNYTQNLIDHYSLVPETIDSVTSFEKIKAQNLLAIYGYFKHKKNQHEFGKNLIEDKETLDWYIKNYKLISTFVNNMKHECSFITPEYLMQHKVYDKSDENQIGRLYAHMSLQIIPKELRYYLFKDEYRDFDLENAHPVILFNYS